MSEHSAEKDAPVETNGQGIENPARRYPKNKERSHVAIYATVRDTPLEEVIRLFQRKGVRFADVRINGSLRWEEPPSDADLARWAEGDRRHAERYEKWERETWERLSAKYGTSVTPPSEGDAS